jgi:RNA polymerase sigma-70 factor, ECF subfamily
VLLMEASSCVEQVVSTPCVSSGFAELYDAHASAVYRLLLAMLCSAADAQDALSDVFLRIARQDLHRIGNHRAYLLASARNAAIAILRRRNRETPTDPTDECLFITEDMDPDRALLARQVNAALKELPPEQREVMVLKIYEDLTFAEIARITHTRPNTVTSRYRYAVEKLRRILKNEV